MKATSVFLTFLIALSHWHSIGPWLRDIAWELFHCLDRKEADEYLENRAAKWFTVIQAVTLQSLKAWIFSILIVKSLL